MRRPGASSGASSSPRPGGRSESVGGPQSFSTSCPGAMRSASRSCRRPKTGAASSLRPFCAPPARSPPPTSLRSSAVRERKPCALSSVSPTKVRPARAPKRATTSGRLHPERGRRSPPSIPRFRYGEKSMRQAATSALARDGEFGTGLRARLEVVRAREREAEYLAPVLELRRSPRPDFSPELALVSPGLSLGELLLEEES